MGAITPTMLVDLETGIQKGIDNGYNSLAKNMWWTDVAKFRTSTFRRDIINWFLNVFQIRDEGKEGGRKNYQDLVMLSTDYETRHRGGAIELNNDQLNDTDGNGWQLAGEWSYEAGKYMAYWPQKETTRFLKTAHLLETAGGFTCYDALPFFSKVHPNNPRNTARGTFANLFSGAPVAAASGTPLYPGACPIDYANAATDDVALKNLTKLFSYVSSIFQANGEDPKRLRIRNIVCGPMLFPRACQLVDAKFLAFAATTGGGSADVTALQRALSFATPVMAEELAGFESDTTFFLNIDDQDQLSGAIYTEREAFSVKYYGPSTIDQLNRRNTHDYEVDGRNNIGAGKPYGLAKCMGT